jgi:AcrR family transcriptional regulator
MRKRPNLLAGESLPPKPRQKRSTHKRERLKDAGLALFGEKGYEGTSIDEISRRANLAVGTFYQHYHSKRQLLLELMDDLLEQLSGIEFKPLACSGVHGMIRGMLAAAFAHDLHYLGAYRAWQEAALTDAGLSRKQKQIHAWTMARVESFFESLQQLPGSRRGVDISGLARAMDSFFWSLLAQAVKMPKPELDRAVRSATHLIYYALFTDPT